MHPPVIPRITTSPASTKETDSNSANSDVQFGSEDPAPTALEEKETQGVMMGTPSHDDDQTKGGEPPSNSDPHVSPRTPRKTKSPEDSPTDQRSPTVRSTRPTVSTTTRLTRTRMLHHRGYTLDLPNSFDGAAGSSSIAEGGLSPVGSTRSRRTWAADETYESRRMERNLSALSIQSAATASPLDFHDLVQIYEIVASRRATFDSLLWSVPSTSFAGKLIEQEESTRIALAGDSSRSARIISMCLSILISFLTLQAELIMHGSKRHNVIPSDRAHGETWRGYREILPVRAGIYAPLAKFRGFSLWSHGMVVIGMVADKDASR
ncbi:BQ2448_4361 [Microbotryum intermedium]|uniref:BQ2448_4361 protein n=1 Tax=Microbotryum intermedium TaxID=269621 RepID=A0A238FLS8_9BASI|nr:BQ2448_4361 [Microbotryum intermedium]